MKKLRKGEHVEVRQEEEGLRGAWHEGVVAQSPRLYRKVKYKHLFDDDDFKDALEENVRVSSAVEGLKNEESNRRKVKKRGYIRPLPPPLNVEMSLSYGLCVDARYADAWWEGVVFDNAENSPKRSRSVFFPDEGDELMIPNENLRVTQDWDEIRGSWRVRGHWMLTKFRRRFESRGFSIKVVWYNLRTHHHFLCKVGEWMHGKRIDWIQCLSKVFKLLEREPSRQLIPALTALGTQSYLNGKESFPTGSRGWKNSSQFQKSNMTNDSILDEDSNPRAIVCCETVDQVWPLNAVVAQDTPIVFSENANKLTERIKNGFCNSLESFSKENYFDKELSKAFRIRSDGHRRRSFTESSKVIGEDVNERASLAYRISSNCEVKGMEQINWSDRVLMKDLVNTEITKQRTGHIGKELYRVVAIDEGLKDSLKSKRNQSFKSSPSECIDMKLLKTSTRDQLNSKNGTSSHQISGKCKLFTLTAGGKLLEKLNAGHQSPSTSSNHEDCVEAILHYKPNSSKERDAKTKTCLLHQGWRIERKLRSNGQKYDTHYFSPKGKVYYSLPKACLAWREENEVERMTAGHWEDAWVKGSTFPSSQEPSVKVKRKMRSSVTKFPKRLWRIDTSQQSPRKDLNNDAFKINNRPRQLVSVVSWSKRLRFNRNKSSVNPEGTCVPELTPEGNFLSNSITPLPVCGWRSKKRKLNVEGSMDVQKQKEAKSSCHVWKTKDTPANWHRMPELPSTPGKSNDSSSCQDRPIDIFNLSWLIENGVVAEKQHVFFMYGKEGWITCEGILCACCNMVYSLTSFEAHAGSKVHRFSVNLRLDDGRSLAQCQMQALRKRKKASSEDKRTRAPSKENKKQAPLNKKIMTNPFVEHDDFCFVCRKNGKVMLCDRCTRSFHEECVSPEKLPGTEEWTKWFCPNCRCDICGGGQFSDDENFTESTVLFCDQCECVFHVGCLDSIGMPELASCPKGKWFCSQKCSEIFSQLRSLVGKVNTVGDGLSWTLLRSTEEDRDPTSDEIIAEGGSDPLLDKAMTKRKLIVAMSVMHDSFSRINEYRTGKDYIEEIIFNRGCERNYLKFQGFYTAILEKGNKLVSVATVRIHGKRAAELPLISTRTRYRRKGMCRLLINEIEKLLSSLHVEKIVLPAIYQLERTWQESFGFQKMTPEEIFDLLKLDIVHFPDTTMLQKILMGASPEQEIFTDDIKNRAEGMHQSLGNVYGLEIQEGIVPENPEISACKIRSYTEFVESVTPLSSWPGKTIRYLKPHSISGEGGCFSGKLQSLSKGFQHSGSALRRRCRIHKNKIEKIECHPGKTPMEDDVDESSVVIMGTTRSNRLVKQVKRKIGYSSCRWEEHKPMRSPEHYLDRKSYKKRIKDKIIVSEKFPATPPSDALESSLKKDIQSGTCEKRKSDYEKSIVCRTNSGIADGNHLSNIKADESILDRSVLEHGSAHVAIKADESILDGSVLEHGSDHVAINRENWSGNSHTVNYNENFRENLRGHLGAQYSFKYVYTRRRKHICS